MIKLFYPTESNVPRKWYSGEKSVLRVKIEESMIRGGIERDVLLSRKLKYTSASYLSVYLK